MAFFLVIYLLYVIAAVVYCEEEVFDISRTKSTDQFIIPSSVCKRTPHQPDCSRFHVRAYVARKCECNCPYEASTFGFNSGSWSCLKNTEFRTKAGCTYKFKSEYDAGFPLEVLEKLRGQQLLSLVSPSDSCKIDLSSSKYLNCDGSWSRLDLSKNSEVFQLTPRAPENDHGPPWDYTLKITKKSPSLTGRVVKLQLNCPASESSCILFKIAGKISCPVVLTQLSSTPISITTTGSNSTKSNVSGNQSGASSGTVAAVVIIIIILVIVVAATIAFIIWKRKRGENVWVIDRISTFATKVRARSSSKVKEEQQQEQIYAEIPDSQNTAEGQATQAHTGTKTAILLSGGSVVPEEPIDDDGYAEPPDSPEYNELEDPNEQSTSDGARAGKLDSYGQQEDSRVVAGIPERSDAVDNKYVAKQRRKPPSPPQQGNDTKERGLVNYGSDVKGHSSEGNDKNHDYETLKDNDRDVYQPLDRSTMEIR